MKVRHWFMSLLILAAVATAYLPLYAAEKVVTVQKVDSEADEKETLINLTFDSAFKGKAPELEGHGGFLQLALPDALTPNPGQFYDVKSPFVQKMAVFQTGPKTVAFRLFVKHNADEIKKAASVDLLGERLMINFDHSKLAGLALDKESSEIAKGLDTEAAKNVSADDVVANTEVRNDILDPVSAITGAAPSIGKEDFNLQKKMIPVAIFSVIMISGLFLLHTVRRFMRRGKKGPDPQTVAMKTIASYSVAPKHKLALVQVGGQQILLGVGPEGINFLTAMNSAVAPTSQPFVMAPQAPMMALEETQSRASERTQSLRKKLVEEKASKELTPSVAKGKKTSTFSVAVGDEGITPVAHEETVVGGQKSIEDVTNLIRRKLKNLPNL